MDFKKSFCWRSNLFESKDLLPPGGVLPYICLIGNLCAAPKGLWFVRLFGLKTAGKDFAYFRLNL